MHVRYRAMLYQESYIPCHVTNFTIFGVSSVEFPLHYNVDSFCASEITKFLRVFARVWKILCSEYPFYQGNYWQTDWPWTLRHRITSKDSTNTFIEQEQFTDFSVKARRKRIIYRYYANEQSDRLLACPLSDKSLPHMTFNPPIQWDGQPIHFVMH
jgi:hypothetical protein